MLKKQAEPNHAITCSKKNCVHWSECQCNSSKTVLCVACKTCQQQRSDDSKDRQDKGDFFIDIEYPKRTRKSKSLRSIAACPQIKDLASGDHDKCNKISNVKRKSTSQFVVNDIGDSLKQIDGSIFPDNNNSSMKEIVTVVEYKNTNYRESSSSSASGSDCVGDFVENRICPRPVICPVQRCSKMLALDSVMLHFYFDHSKVPRMSLSLTSPGQLTLRPRSLSTDTQCLAVFTLQDHKSDSLLKKVDSGTHNDCKSVLLMGAKMVIENPKVDKKQILRKKSNARLMMNENKTNPLLTVNVFENTEILMLWLCKLDDNSVSYSITVSNKNQGHQYIGKASHIREDQSAISVYKNAECLFLHGAAVNKLLNEQNHIPISVSIIE